MKKWLISEMFIKKQNNALNLQLDIKYLQRAYVSWIIYEYYFILFFVSAIFYFLCSLGF